MNKTTVYIGLSLLAINILCWLLLSSYHPFNMMVNSIVIVVTTVIIWLLWMTKQKTPFAISLSFIYSFIGIVQIVLGCMSAESMKDNWRILAIIGLLAFEIILFIIVNAISKNVK